jgi:hypothetical protein
VVNVKDSFTRINLEEVLDLRCYYGSMATAAVSIAPALTPQTVTALADTFERVQLSEKAQILRQLRPFVEDTVNRCFVPLVQRRDRSTFPRRFDRLSREFEPFRLYLNFRLAAVIGNADFLRFYEATLQSALESLVGTAREMDMGPELIVATVRDYLNIIRVMVQGADLGVPQHANPTGEQFTEIVKWFHAATRFDYGLTAVFLVLETTIPKPLSTEKRALLSALKKALLEFGRATGKVVVHEHINHALQHLETPQIKITGKGQRLRVEAPAPFDHKLRTVISVSSPRQREMNWISRTKDLADRYGGQWIVIEKDELVANDPDYRKAREAATQRGIRRPFIIFVPVRDSDGFMGI